MTSRTEKSDDQYKCRDQVETQQVMGRPKPAYDGTSTEMSIGTIRIRVQGYNISLKT